MPGARTHRGVPGCRGLKTGYARPIDQRKIRPPRAAANGPPVTAIKKGPLFVASQRPPTLRRNRGPTHLLFGVSHGLRWSRHARSAVRLITSRVPMHFFVTAGTSWTLRKAVRLRAVVHRAAMAQRAQRPASMCDWAWICGSEHSTHARPPLAQSRPCRIRSRNVLCSRQIKNGVARGATKPGKDGKLFGLRSRDRLAFPGCIN